MKSLKTIRTERKLTLKQTSDLTGVTVATLNNIERGMAAAQRDSRLKIERVFGIVNWLDTQFIDVSPRDYSKVQKAAPEIIPWQMAETSFRSLVHEVMALSQVERKGFCTAAVKHLQKISDIE